MYSLCDNLLERYPHRYPALALALNERAAITAGLIESRLPEGWPYVGLNGLVLSETERVQIARLSETFGRIYRKALSKLVTNADDATLLALGWPEYLNYALRHEPPNRYLTPIGRFDFVVDGSQQWHLLEFNSDTPSGSQEVTLVEALLMPVLRRIAPVQALNPHIGQALIDALIDEALFAPVPTGFAEVYGPLRRPKIGFLVRGRYLTDLAQVIFYAQGLAQAGFEVIIGDPANLGLVNGHIFLTGKPIDALYRLYQIESLSQEPLFMAYLQANLVGGLKCLNNLRGFFAQSKALMAWIWRERHNSELFDSVEQQTIAQYLPETHLLQDLPADFDRRDFIIKEFYGREGAEVFNGAIMTDEEWEACRQWRTYVAQRRIEIAPVPHALVTADGEVARFAAYPCVGGFLIAEHWAGCYSRIGAFITNSQAQFIPTLTIS